MCKGYIVCKHCKQQLESQCWLLHWRWRCVAKIGCEAIAIPWEVLFARRLMSYPRVILTLKDSFNLMSHSTSFIVPILTVTKGKREVTFIVK